MHVVCELEKLTECDHHLTTYVDIGIEEEAQPVGKQLLCYRLCPSQEELGVTLAHGGYHESLKQLKEDAAGIRESQRDCDHMHIYPHLNVHEC